MCLPRNATVPLYLATRCRLLLRLASLHPLIGGGDGVGGVGVGVAGIVSGVGVRGVASGVGVIVVVVVVVAVGVSSPFFFSER